MAPGEPVVVAGAAREKGQAELSVSTGVGGAPVGGGPGRQFMPVTVPIQPGNSGGPLLNMQGEVVGVNTALDRQSPGIGFAVGTDTINRVVDQLITMGEVARGFLGVTLAAVNPASRPASTWVLMRVAYSSTCYPTHRPSTRACTGRMW